MNTQQRHGICIGIERIQNEFFLSLKAVGKLTHDDYNSITPMLDSALQGIQQPKINAFIDASELEGWELRAAWDDLKLGIRHGAEFERIAIFGQRKWQKVAAKIANWFISGEVRFFENAGDALKWLKLTH